MDGIKKTDSTRSHQDLTRLFKVVFLAGLGGSVLSIAMAGAVMWYFSRGLPQIITVEDYRPLTVTRILGAGGKEDSEIGEFFKERRYLIPYDKIPDTVVKAFIAAEDDRFFEHPGINIASIIRAGIANFRAGHVVQGGSTITQQVAKSLLLTSQRSLDRKIKEVILASRIEKNLTKQQILYLYLNQIYLGHGAYGVQAATRTYFRKDISQISVAEAALLAGMPQAPGKYSPLLNSKRAKERQLYVLRRMMENHFITQSQMNEAANLPLRVYHDEDLNGKYAPYFVEHIRRYLIEKYGEKAVYEEGLRVSVPVTRELSESSTKSLRKGLLALDKRIGYRGPLKHLATQDEMEKFLEQSRLKMIERKAHFQMFMPDGRMDPIEAMKNSGMDSDSDLLDPGELYEAVVTGFDNGKKSAHVMIGAVRGELSIANMKWAKPVRDDKNPSEWRPEPSLPSKVFKKGDVILVGLPETTPGTKPGESPKKEAFIPVALEQEPVVQGALLSMDVQTGHVLSMIGGYSFESSEFNRAIQAARQPGSAFKPVIYASALEKGFTPASVIVDSPLVFRDADGSSAWKPSNYEEKFYGDTTFRQALIKSRNIPTVKIVQAVQVPYLIEYARRLGMGGQFNLDLSISLGSATSSLLDLTRVYALFPRLGRKITPIFISKVEDRDGKVIEELKPDEPRSPTLAPPAPATEIAAAPVTGVSPTATDAVNSIGNTERKVVFPAYPLAEDPAQLMDPRIAFVMTHLMTEVVTFGTGHGAKSLGRPAAGKTGTTNDSIDAWFMGFTPHVVTGVWVGYDNQKSLGPGETGARAALPIWLSFMKDAVKPYPPMDFPVPQGVVFENIDPNTGKLAAANSSTAIKEAFISGTEPTVEGAAVERESKMQSDFFKEDRE